MKILHILPEYYPVYGGIIQHIRLISEHLAGLGEDVTVLTSDLTSYEGYYSLGVAKIGRKNEIVNKVKIVRISYGGIIYKIASLFSRLIFIEYIRKRFDAIVLSMLEILFARSVANFILRSNPDIVLASPHALVNVLATKKAHQSNSFPFVFLPCLHEAEVSRIFNDLKKILEESDGVIAMTDHEALCLGSFYPAEKNKIVTIEGLVDTSGICETKKLPRDRNILFLGRKNIKKGIPLLLEAMKIVWRDHPEVDLVLAGRRELASREIDELIASLPADYYDHVKSFDDISEEEKNRLLSTSLCLVLPSRVESFGLVLLEAWAHSTAVIAFDLPVFSSFIENGKDGILVSAGDPKSLAQGIIKLILDPELAASLGISGRQKAIERFDIGKNALAYLEFYKKVVSLKKHT